MTETVDDFYPQSEWLQIVVALGPSCGDMGTWWITFTSVSCLFLCSSGGLERGVKPNAPLFDLSGSTGLRLSPEDQHFMLILKVVSEMLGDVTRLVFEARSQTNSTRSPLPSVFPSSKNDPERSTKPHNTRP